jgi:CheY-like chemotaxis protein
MTKKKPRILIVDDEKGFTKLTKLTLADYEICEENNSAQAVETARKFQPDLVLLDVVMPDVDGGDIAAQLRAEDSLKNVPIIFVTAIVTEKETQKRQLFGGYPFISKPVTPEKLAEEVEKHLPRG